MKSEEMMSYEDRKASFQGKKSADELAGAGFYLKDDATLSCPFCNITVPFIEYKGRGTELHAGKSPNCMFAAAFMGVDRIQVPCQVTDVVSVQDCVLHVNSRSRQTKPPNNTQIGAKVLPKRFKRLANHDQEPCDTSLENTGSQDPETICCMCGTQRDVFVCTKCGYSSCISCLPTYQGNCTYCHNRRCLDAPTFHSC